MFIWCTISSTGWLKYRASGRTRRRYRVLVLALKKSHFSSYQLQHKTIMNKEDQQATLERCMMEFYKEHFESAMLDIECKDRIIWCYQREELQMREQLAILQHQVHVLSVEREANENRIIELTGDLQHAQLWLEDLITSNLESNEVLD